MWKKKVDNQDQHHSLFRMVKKTYPKSAYRKKKVEVGFKKIVKKVG